MLLLLCLLVGSAFAFPNPADVSLGNAAPYAVLAGSTITSTGPTAIVGDLGIWTGSALTATPAIVLTGSTHLADPSAQAAQSSLLTAYDYCKSRASNALLPVEIGGMTLTPGVYTAEFDELQITSILTLDGQSLPNPVFIFQMATTLKLNTGGSILLINGARASGVFWQVGSAVTLAANVAMVGTLMAKQAISFGSGTTLTGRALAIIAAVTMDTNTITKPVAGGGGDPVFYAFNSGNKYHWQGVPDKVVAIVSDAHLQFNALLSTNLLYGNGHGTFMTSFGFSTHHASLVIHTNRSMSINRGVAMPLTALTKPHFDLLYPSFTGFKLMKNGLRFHAPNWGFTVKFSSEKKANTRQQYLDFSIEDMYSGSDKQHLVHGVLGHTYMHLGPIVSDPKKCNKNGQGGCYVEGPPRDYFVQDNDILGTQWAHTLFAASNDTVFAINNLPSAAPLRASAQGSFF
eukprot:Mycagemm_TRINITY_DN9344_c0_g1::TRINITY_DN9344_c0_g1_i1::g.3146::m.3146 type:complete len:459 gc:universal TRINITY_DN9344_c0_g1_i1:76-1452(+)